MNIDEARTLALKLMTDHGLVVEGWQLDFDGSIRRFAVTEYKQRKIILSRHVIEVVDAAELEQTMLHEIAHALLPSKGTDGRNIGHGRRWKVKASSIGYTGGIKGFLPAQLASVTTALSVPSGSPHNFVIGDNVTAIDDTEGVVTELLRKNIRFVTADGRTMDCDPRGLTITKSV